MQVFRVEMFDLVEVPEEKHGVFFAGDCYVILYAYRSIIIMIMMVMSMVLMMMVAMGVMMNH